MTLNGAQIKQLFQGAAINEEPTIFNAMKRTLPFTHDVKDQSHYQDFNFLGGMCTFLDLTSSVSAFKALYLKNIF